MAGAIAHANEINECDLLSGHPYDQNKEGDGVEWNDLDPNLAIPACNHAEQLQSPLFEQHPNPSGNQQKTQGSPPTGLGAGREG